MNKPTKKQFRAEVAKEIKHLAKVITDEQKAKLNFETFVANNTEKCIYGQLTGGSYTAEARELYPRKYSHCANWDGTNSFEKQNFSEGTCYTGLEKYILMVDAEMHKHIISYLKGNIKHLRLYL